MFPAVTETSELTFPQTLFLMGSLKLCMMMTCIRLYIFILVLVRLDIFIKVFNTIPILEVPEQF